MGSLAHPNQSVTGAMPVPSSSIHGPLGHPGSPPWRTLLGASTGLAGEAGSRLPQALCSTHRCVFRTRNRSSTLERRNHCITPELWVKGSTRRTVSPQGAPSMPIPRAAVASNTNNGTHRAWCPGAHQISDALTGPQKSSNTDQTVLTPRQEQQKAAAISSHRGNRPIGMRQG